MTHILKRLAAPVALGGLLMIGVPAAQSAPLVASPAIADLGVDLSKNDPAVQNARFRGYRGYRRGSGFRRHRGFRRGFGFRRHRGFRRSYGFRRKFGGGFRHYRGFGRSHGGFRQRGFRNRAFRAGRLR